MTQAQYAQFDKANKAHSVFDLDQLKLEPKETARILLLDPAPMFAWSHFVTTPHEERRGKYVTCLGENDTLMTGQPDASRCPGCAFVAANPESDRVSRARRRFAIHIGRYRTNKHGEVLQPISLGLEVWVFGDDKFGKLVDRTTEHGDLRRHDIRVTCTSAQYQQYDLDVSPTVLAASTPEASAQYKAIVAARSGELGRILSTALSFEKFEALIEGGSATPVIRDAAVAVADAQKVFDDLLGDIPSAEDSVDAVLGDAVLGGEPTVGEAETGTTAAKVDFDDLFKDL